MWLWYYQSGMHPSSFFQHMMSLPSHSSSILSSLVLEVPASSGGANSREGEGDNVALWLNHCLTRRVLLKKEHSHICDFGLYIIDLSSGSAHVLTIELVWQDFIITIVDNHHYWYQRYYTGAFTLPHQFESMWHSSYSSDVPQAAWAFIDSAPW